MPKRRIVNKIDIPKPIQAVKKPSEELLEMIRIANLVPFVEEIDLGHRLEHINNFPLLAEHLLSIDPDSKSEAYFNAYYDFVDIRNFIKVLVEISEDYQDYLKTQAKLNWLIAQARAETLILPNAETLILPNAETILPKFEVTSVSRDTVHFHKRLFDIITFYLKLTTDESHQIKVEFRGFVETIKGQDLRRFRKCFTCQKFFWAYRLNTKFCERKCLDRNHQKKIRQDPVKNFKINEQRRENRIYKKRGGVK